MPIDAVSIAFCQKCVAISRLRADAVLPMGHSALRCAGGRPIANAAGAACSGFAVLLSYYPGYSYPYPDYSYCYPGYSYPYPVEHLPCGQDVGVRGWKGARGTGRPQRGRVGYSQSTVTGCSTG